MNRPDKEALKILLKYRYGQPESISNEEFEHAKSHGLMFDEQAISHNECIERLFESGFLLPKKHYTDLFLASLSSGYLDWRCGLPVYAIMQTFPKHTFTDIPGQTNGPCLICSDMENKSDDFILTNKIRFKIGGLLSHSLDDYWFYLHEHNKLSIVTPVQADFDIFSAIMEVIINADDDDKAKKETSSKINKIKSFKSNKDQRQVLLETLGYCSILETQEHEGPLTKYTNLANSPRTHINTDWSYPADFWKGRDGINKQAFKFWFGDYPELEKFWA